MTGETPPPPSCSDHFRDSCSYSVEVSKQFLTFAAGGVAFLVATALTPTSRVSPLFYWSFGAFVLSLLLGLVYIMQVVGHINLDKNYDVYSRRLRVCSALQLVTTVTGAVLLGVVVFRMLPAREGDASLASGVLEVKTASQQARYALPAGATLSLKTNEKGEIECRAELKPAR